ncbi:MAG: spondin domain-containing protein [Gemmatimonadota bacterium]|nr:spondin domain-containing protein [Gemmatimonadota bacterium]
MRTLRTATLLALLAPAAIHAQYGNGRAVQFTVRVENVSTPQTLKLSNGMTAPAPTAPVLWAITDGDNPLFTPGRVDRGLGLERLAEEGNPGVLADYVRERVKAVAASGAVAMPVGDAAAGPIAPGKAYEFMVSAIPGQKLTLAFMFGQSNDWFYASGPRGIALFDAGGKPLSRDITSDLALWDAGTEVNEEPGLGANQAPRQAAPNTGTAERNPVRLVRQLKGEYADKAPRTTDVIRVTVSASDGRLAGNRE